MPAEGYIGKTSNLAANVAKGDCPRYLVPYLYLAQPKYRQSSNLWPKVRNFLLSHRPRCHGLFNLSKLRARTKYEMYISSKVRARTKYEMGFRL